MDIGLGRRRSGWSVGIAALAAMLTLLDFVVLRGDQVASVSVSLASETGRTLHIEQAGEEHLVQIATYQRRHGERRGRSVDYWIEDPEGYVVAEESEIMSHEVRFVRFVPDVAGSYQVGVTDESLLGSAHGTARVTVYMNDRRVVSPLLRRLLPF